MLAAAAAGTVFSLCVAVAPAQALPSGPPNLRVVTSSTTRIQIAWDPPATASSSYRVHYSTSANFSPYKAVTVTPTTYVAPSLKPATTYYFRVAGLSGGTRVTQFSPTVSGRTKTPMKISVASYNIKDPDADPPWAPFSTRGRQSAAAVIGQGVKLLGVQEVFEEDDRVRMLSYINEKVAGTPYSMVPAPGVDDGEDSRVVFHTGAFRHVASGGRSFANQNGSEDRAFAWAKLQHRASGRYVLFVTTHLSPRSDAHDVLQWKELIGWLNRRRNETPYYKFIVTGDFNTTKFESPATMLATMRSNGYEDVLGQIRNSYSTYRDPSVRVDSWISTSNKGDGSGRYDLRQCGCLVSTSRNANSIDYIFVSKALKATSFRVYAQPRDGLVMKYLMSDHFMVRATISE